MTDLTGHVVCDLFQREYTVKRHYIEADELLLERGNEVRSITMIDIADGPFEVVNE